MRPGQLQVTVDPCAAQAAAVQATQDAISNIDCRVKQADRAGPGRRPPRAGG
jgi:hypothetical protein